MHFTIRDQIAVAKEGRRLRDPSDARLALAVSALVDNRAAERLVATVGRAGLRQMSAPELAAVGKVALPTAERIIAARELGELLAHRDGVVSSASAVLDRLPPGLATLETEVMLGFALSTSLAVKALLLISKGGISGAAVTPQDVFVPLVRIGASAVIIVHNHPSGDATPSEEIGRAHV
jgi:DNA repair protein RadC